MNLSPDPMPDNGAARLEPVDPRLAAFQRFLGAVDGANWRDGLAASKELRRLGISVVLLPPRRGEEGGR